MRFRALLALLVLISGSFHSLRAADCPRFVGPGQYNNTPLSWGTDSGPIVHGHIALWGQGGKPAGKIFKAEFGTDLSKYDFRDAPANAPDSVVDFPRLRECGTTFAFSRIAYKSVDKHFKDNDNLLKSAGLINIPYFFFPIDSSLRDVTLYQNKDADKINEFLTKFDTIGRDAAADFISQLAGLNISQLPVVQLSSVSGQFVSLDVEQKLCKSTSDCANEPDGNFEAKTQYGRYYAKAACSWIEAVQTKFPDLVVILYTVPSVWGDYLANAYPQEAACLSQIPVWIARTVKNGGDYDGKTNSNVDKQVQQLCRINAGDRCIIHQYSHRGIFATKGARNDSRWPNHIDISRFFDAKAVDTQLGRSFVRTLAEVQPDTPLSDSDLDQQPQPPPQPPSQYEAVSYDTPPPPLPWEVR